MTDARAALWLMLEYEWEPVLRRLTAAGWVKRSWTLDKGGVRDSDLYVEFTPLGFQRLAQLHQCYAEIGSLTIGMQEELWQMLLDWAEVLPRLTAAGWVKRSWTRDAGGVPNTGLNIALTPLGLQRLAQLQRCFAEIGRLDTMGHWICLEGLCWLAQARSLA
jgi:DNA-binding PadR family transcriptional regulator